MFDFNISIYTKLLTKLKEKDCKFYPVHLYNSIDSEKVIILKHDVDRLPQNAFKTAKIENQLGIQGTYYFRKMNGNFAENIISNIAKLGHEIGYHYEDLAEVGKHIKVRSEKDKELLLDLAYESFCKNLEKLNQIVAIKTIAMHGSPTSHYNNKMIWEKYSYKDLGIIYEPYSDINWNEFGYLTDTGRTWDGQKFNVRDKVNSKCSLHFRTTQQIIDNVDTLPDKLVITIHPERWTNNWFMWSKNLVYQNIKNVVKWFLILTNNQIIG